MDDFVDIPGYPGYKINRKGECLGQYGRLLKPGTNGKGYKQVSIYNDGEEKMLLVHRLVGFTFIPNPLELPTIDHIDNNPANNCVDNLRWMTQADQIRRQDRNVNAKCYHRYKYGWRVHYTIEGNRHYKCFKHEDDAEFYVSLLKAIYPRF